MKKIFIDWQELKQQLDRKKALNKKIVFTNGCFDIVHIGHVRYLYEAKGLGDILVVGVNTDKSVSRIKPGRPVISQEQRMEVLSALEMVDFITAFDNETPLQLIRTIKPDILVKGSDWALEAIIGKDEVKEVFRLSYVEGVSTSAIIKKIVTAEAQSLKNKAQRHKV